MVQRSTGGRKKKLWLCALSQGACSCSKGLAGLRILLAENRESRSGLAGKGPQSPPIAPLPWQGHIPLSQLAARPVQPGLGHFQGSRGSHSCSGHSVPGPAHPLRQEFLPNIPSNPALLQAKAIHSCPITACQRHPCNLISCFYQKFLFKNVS